MGFSAILESVRRYYTEKIETYGPTARGVDWNSNESQVLRFEQLLKSFDKSTAFSINDYGCGYGALLDYLIDKGYSFDYTGFDISEQMLKKAGEVHSGVSGCKFIREESSLRAADYTVASGIFNVKLLTDTEEWERYVLDTLEKISRLSTKGFAFNALTKYSDPERMRSDLYYADPLALFDKCKREFSRFVSLLHDYPLYEFTIVVRKAQV